MSVARIASLALAAAIVSASPCPYGDMAEKGQLSKADSAKFFKARAEGHPAVAEMMSEPELQKREFDRQEEFYKHQLKTRQLDLGGGLLSGVLVPFTGVLEGLHLPTPQEFSLKVIPGDDPAHQFIAPKKGDVRGMCPTLNTMANHGYINRNGITTFAQAANACQITLGFGYDTCTFLSALGLLSGGDLPTGAYSIGGADSRVPNTLGPALGISTHGPFEIDQSISRVDSYFGNSAEFNLDRWNQLVDIANQNGGNFGMSMWAQERALTYKQSRTTNPSFDAGPKALVVNLAERVFIPRALPNGTTPDLADFANVAPFYLNETFPENWFRRATPYSLVNTGTDIVSLFLMSPTQIGHNEGTDNFIPASFDLQNLEDGSGLCFIEQTILSLAPGQLSPTIANSWDIAMSFLNGAVKPFFANANCKGLSTDPPAKGTTYAENGPSAPSEQLINGKYQ